MKAIHLDKKDVPEFMRTIGGYRGRKFKAVVTESVSVYGTQWDGGSRTQYYALALASPESLRQFRDPRPWPENMGDVGQVDIPPQCIIVAHSIFCGKDMGLTFYVRPENTATLLPEQSKAEDMTHAERVVLSVSCSLKSAYRREKAERYHNVGKADYDTALVSLKARGYLKSNNAVTTAGKNARPGDIGA